MPLVQHELLTLPPFGESAFIHGFQQDSCGSVFGFLYSALKIIVSPFRPLQFLYFFDLWNLTTSFVTSNFSSSEINFEKKCFQNQNVTERTLSSFFLLSVIFTSINRTFLNIHTEITLLFWSSHVQCCKYYNQYQFVYTSLSFTKYDR